MKISELIAYVDAVKPNAFDTAITNREVRADMK